MTRFAGLQTSLLRRSWRGAGFSSTASHSPVGLCRALSSRSPTQQRLLCVRPLDRLSNSEQRPVPLHHMWLDFLSEKRHNRGMEAGVRELRDNLSRYLSIVRDGHDVTVTDHGKAVARLVPLDQPRTIDRLISEGLISPPVHQKRPRTAPPVRGSGTVSDLVAEQRR